MNVHGFLLQRVFDCINESDFHSLFSYASVMAYSSTDADFLKKLKSIQYEALVKDDVNIGYFELLMLEELDGSSVNQGVLYKTGCKTLHLNLYDIDDAIHRCRREILLLCFKSIDSGKLNTSVNHYTYLYKMISWAMESDEILLMYDYAWVAASLFGGNTELSRLNYLVDKIDVTEDIEMSLNELLRYNTSFKSDSSSLPTFNDEKRINLVRYDIIKAVEYVKRVLLITFCDIAKTNSIDFDNNIDDEKEF